MGQAFLPAITFWQTGMSAPLRDRDHVWSRLRRAQLMPQELATALEELMIVSPLVIGIGPWPACPRSMMKEQRVFRVNAAVQINPMIAVLGCCEYQLCLRQVARIEIKR